MCNLACWNEDWGSFLPFKEASQYDFIKSKEAMKHWLHFTGKCKEAYVAMGIRYLDHYCNDFVPLERINEDNIDEFDGAIFIDHLRFVQKFALLSRKSESMAAMNELIQDEFNMLRAYISSCVFGFIIEYRFEVCNSWVFKDSMWNFYCLSPDPKEMYNQMSYEWPNTPEFNDIRRQMGVI
jgi:hypothetical protein